jgi:hypothetical protein
MTATSRELRPENRLAKAGSVRIALAASTVVAALLVGAWLFVVQPAGDEHHSEAAHGATFLAAELGAARPSAPRVRTPARAVRVELGRHGTTLRRDGHDLTLAAIGAGDAAWTRHAHGTSRTTPFGRETITVGPTSTEEFLTVARRLGPRTWSWKLGSTTLEPKLNVDGSVQFRAGDRLAGLRIRPVSIFDAAGRDVTPAGSRWRLTRSAHGWLLQLRLDDSDLPVPYVIDPAADYPSPLYISSAAAGGTVLTNGWNLPTASAAPANATTVSEIARNTPGYVQWQPGVNPNVTAAVASLPAAPTGRGWIVGAGGASGFPAGQWSFNVETKNVTGTLGESAIVAVKMWKVVLNGTGGITSSTAITGLGDDPAAQNVHPADTAVHTWTISYPSVGAFSLGATEKLYVEFWRKQVTTIPVNNPSTDRDIVFYANDGANTSIAHPAADSTAPTHSLSLTPVSGGSYYKSSNTTIYYKGNALGSFTLSDTLVDGGSGGKDVTYPAVGTANWTYAGQTVSTGPAFTSSAWSWNANPTNPANKTINATDNALNAATGLVVSFATDITAPGTPSLALSGGPYYTTASVPLTPTDGTDAGSGVNTASRVYQRDEVALSNNACATPFPGTWSNVTLSGGADTTVVSGKCYRYRYTVADNVGNTSAASAASGTAMVDTSAPSAPAFTITAGTATATDGTTTAWYKPSAASGSFSVAAASTDAQTGISSYTFPALTGWTRSLAGATATYSHTGSPSDPTEPNNVTATNNASTASSPTSFTVTPDPNAPTGMSASVTAGYFTTASVHVTLANGSDGAGESGVDATTGIVERDEIALSNGTCGVFPGSWTTVTLNGSGDDTTVQSGKCYRYRYKISDKVGNQGTQAGTSGTAKVDTDGPGAPTFAFSALSSAYDNGSNTIFFRGGAAGGFTVTPTATDAQSGVASYAYPTLGSGWSNTAGAYTFTAAAVDPTEPNNVHGVNNAGTNGTDASFTITRDPNAPTGMSAAITGGYYTSTSIRVTLANGTDGAGESGVDSTTGVVERDVANLAGDVCAAFPGTWSTVTLNGSGDDTSVLSGKCYRYRYKISDRVGNQGTQAGTSSTAKVDTTGPAAPTFAFSGFTRASATGTTVYFKTGTAGGFTVTPTATDAETGVSSYAYPALGSGWSNTAGAYTFTAAAVDPTEPNNAHGVNAAGTAGTDASFTVTADGNAPTGMSAAVTAGYVTTATAHVTLANGSDGAGESGVDSTTGVVERDEAPLLAGACDPFPGSWTTVTLNGSGDDTTVLTGKCYRYRYKISDKVGNQGTQAGTSGTVKVDTSKPTTPSLAFSALTNAYDNGSGTVFFRTGAAGGLTVASTSSDPESGIASTTFPALATGWSHTAGAYTFTSAAADPAEPNDVFTTNGAGLDSLHQSFTVTADGNAPTGMSAAVTAGYVASTSVHVTLANGSDGAGESGVNAASGVVERDEAPLLAGACDPFPGSWTTVTLNGSGDDTTLQTGKCYRYRYKISDRVGNQGTQAGTSGTVKVDTTAPSAPSLAYSGFTRAWEDGSGTVYFKGGAAGGFTVTPSASDAQSGVSSYAYPTLGSGWSNTGGAYTFNSASDPVEPNNVHAVNGAGTSGADTSFTVTRDSSLPTGMSATVTGGFSSSTTVAVTLANGSDTGSGVDASTGVVERDEAPLVSGTCDPFPGTWTTVALSGGNDTAPSGKCYRYRYSISDRVGNQGVSAASATVKVDTSKPSAPALSFAGLSNAYDNGSGTVFFRGGAAGGFTVNSSSADAESGVASTAFPALGSGWSESAGAYTFTAAAADPAEPNNVHTTNGAGLDSNSTSFTVTADSNAPTTTAQCGGAACSAGWYTTSPVSVTLAAADGAGSGVQAIRYTTDGTDPTAFSTTYAGALSIGSTTTVKFRAWDRVGNLEAVGTIVVQIDATPPSAPALTLSESSPSSFVSGSTLYYNPSGANAASFTVDGTSSDGESPLDKLTFPALTGMTGGGDDSSSPYSATYDWTASSTATGGQTVTARNAAGLTAGTAFTVTPDTGAPTGMSATVSAGFTSSTTVAVTLANGSDGGAGVDASSGVVERDEAPLLAGACDPFPGSWTVVALSGGNDTVVTGKCYRYRYKISDRVGNQGVSGASATVKVDATAPSAPSLAFSALTAAYDNGSGTVYYRPSAGAGSFTVAAASSDAQSGVSAYSFPTAPSGWTRSLSGATATFAHSGSPAEPGAGQNVHATNAAGVDSADTSFAVTADASAPTGMSATTGGGYATSTSIHVTLANGSDSGSGLAPASGVVERDEATLAGDSCSAFPGSWTPVALNGSGDDTGVVSGKCYRYRYKISDRVGNQGTSGASAAVKVDTDGPSAPALWFGSFTAASSAGSTVFFRPGASGGFTVSATSADAETGVASTSFPALGSGWTRTGGAYSFDGTAGDPAEPNDVHTTNAAGLDSTATSFTVTADATAPTTTPQCNGGACATWFTSSPVSVSLSAADGAGSGVGAIRFTTDGSDPTALSSTYSGPISVGATTTVKFRAWDNVGNLEAVGSVDVRVDTTAPSAPSLTLSERPASAYQHVSGTTLFYNPSASNAGGFRVDGTSADAESGIQKLTFPSLAAMTGGGDATSSPYRGDYDWTSASTATGAQTVTARNAAGLTATSTFDVTVDTAAPTGQTLALDAGPWFASTSVALTSGDGGDAAGSGIDRSSRVLERDEADLTNGSCGTFSGSWTQVSSPDTSVVTGKCYRYRFSVADNVANRSAPVVAAVVAKVDTSAPSAPSLAFSGFTSSSVTGSTVYFRGGAAGGFTLAPSSADAQSGVASYAYPALGSGWSRSGGTYSFTSSAAEPGGGQNVHATNAAGTDSANTSFAVMADSTAPTTSIACDGAACSNGWVTSFPVSVTLSATDAGSGVDHIVYSTDGSDPTSGGTTYAGAFDVNSTTTVKYAGYDKVGNVESVGSTQIRIDSTPPTAPSLTLTPGASSSVTGSTVFFRPGAAGDFTVAASSTDGESGVAGYTFPALGIGWTHTAGSYDFDSSAGDPSEPNGVTARNTAGLDSAATSFTVTADSSAPTTSAQCEGAACSSGYYTATPVAVTLAADDGTGSGVDKIRYTTDGSAPTASSTAYTGAISVATTTTVKFRAWDKVGNAEAVDTVLVKIDASVPDAPALTLSESSPGSFVSGSTVFYNPSGSNSGNFTVAATTGDAESGIQHVSFPSLGGMTGGGTQPTAPFSETYGWSASSTATGSHSVTATNNAGLNASTSFTVTADTTAPSGGSVSYADGWNTSGSVTVTTADGTDGGSGIDASSGVLERQFAAVSAGACDAFGGAWTQVTSPDSPANGCYRYRYRLSDNVGNERIYTSAAVVQVDTTAPSAPSLAFSAFSNATASGPTVWFRPGAAGGFTVTPSSSDAQSGVSSYSYPALGSGWSRSGGAYTFTGSAAEPGAGQTVHATNGAGTSSADTAFTVSADSTAPSSTIDCDGGVCAGWHTASPVSVTFGGTDAQSGLGRIVYTTDGSDPTSGGTMYSGPFGVASTSTVKYAAYDKVGNVESVHTTTIQIDTTPASAPTLGFAGFTAASATGTTVYYRPGAGAGSFDVSASSADAQSGVAGYAFPAAAAGWSRTLSGATATYAHTGSPTEPGSGQTVTAQNGAGLSSAASAFTVSADSTAPSSTIACVGAACSAGWYTSAPVSVTLAASDAASGVDRIVYTTDGSDPTSGGTTYAGAFGVSATTTVKYAAYDNVGNVESVKSRTIQVDTTAPSAPTFAFSGFTNAHATGSTVYFRPASSGGFTVTPSSTDAQSGVASYAFPSLGSGWTRSGGGYGFNASAGDPAEPNNVTATNNAGLTSAGASFTVTADSTAPASSMQCDGTPCGNGWATSSPVSITLSAADGGAGVKEIRYTTDGSDPLAGGGTLYSGAFDVAGSTTVKFAAVDEVGNAESVQSKLIRIDTTPPSAPTLGFSALTNASVSGSTVYFRGGAAGSFTVTGAATDAQSGVASYSFPALGSGWSGSVTGADDTYSFSATAVDPSEPNDVRATNAAGQDSAATSFTVTRDGTAPSTTVQCGGGACSAGWYTTSPVSVTLSASDGGSGVDRIVYTTDGSDPTSGGTTYSGAISVTTTATVRYAAYDKVGNVESVNAQQVRVDTTAPTTSAGIANAAGSVHVNGSTVYYRPGGSGGFDLTATVTDGQSGAQKASFPSIGGFGSGGDVAAPGPYSSTYSYSGTPAQPGTVGVTGHNNAGLTSADNVTITADATAPSSSIACNGSPCASGWTTSAPVSIALSATDGGSGVDHIAYSTDGSDPTSGGTTYAAPFPVSASTTVKWAAFDRVGNVESVHSETIQIDTTAPSAPTLGVSAVTNAILSGTTVFFRPGIAGGFNVTASSTDGESGVASYMFPALGGGWSASGTGASRAYSFGAAAVDPAEPNNVTATNGAGQASAPTSFTVTADSTAPTGGGVSYVDGFRSNASVALTLDDGSDSGAGVETTTEVLERSVGTLANGACTGFGSFNTLVVDPSLAYTDLTVASGNCYAYRYLVQDRVGNLRTYTTSAVAKIDLELPAATQGNPGLYMHGTVTLTGTATDTGGSDVAALTFQYSDDSGATWKPIGNDTSSPYSVGFDTTTAATPDGTYDLRTVATDNAGNSSPSPVVSGRRVDNTPPSATIDSPAPYVRGVVGLSATTSDSGSGISMTSYQFSGDGGATWTTTPASWNTALSSDGLYRVRVVATDNAGNQATDASGSFRVDNTPPTAVLTDPGANLRGTVDLASTASDSGSGVDTVTYERSAAGAGTWTSIPASWNTTSVSDGLYDLRVVVVDRAGNRTNSAPRAGIRVDNTPPNVTLDNPVSNSDVAATVTLASTATDTGSGLAGPVTYEYRTASPVGAWTATPAAWNTTLLPDGGYDLRATAVDRAGNTKQSNVAANVRVDNTPPAISLTTPVDGSYVNAAAADPFGLAATATDAGSGVKQVEFFECSNTSVSCATGSWSSVAVDAAPGPYGAYWAIPADGHRALRAVATDNADRTTVALADVTVDRTLPDTTIVTKPGDPSHEASPTFTFSSNETGATFKCSLDGASFTTCASPLVLPALADGTHAFAVRATDLAGNTDASDATWSWLTDLTPPNATMDNPGVNVRGVVALTSSQSDPGGANASGVASVNYEFSSDDGASWAPTPASWDTAPVTDGLYKLRVVVLDNAGNQTIDQLAADVRVDNTAPSSSQDDPGAYLRSGITLTGSAADPDDPAGRPGSGVTQVRFEVSPSGADSWTTVGTSAGAPYSAALDTTTLADGRYDFRTVATDAAGNEAPGGTVTSRLVDNTVPTASVGDPGANLRGTVTLGSTTADPGANASGIASVDYEVSSGGGWVSVPDTWSTSSMPDGLYDIRVTATDRAGNSTTSSPIGGRRVDNTPPSTTDNAPADYQSSDVTVSLSASDGGSGVSVTEYSVDGGGFQAGSSVTIGAPADGSNDGTHTISYFSADVAGNIESPKTTTVQIDATPPVCPTCGADDYLRGTETLTANPGGSLSGIKSVTFEYAAEGAPRTSPPPGTWTQIAKDTTAPYSAAWATNGVADGAYDLRLIIESKSGASSTTYLDSKVVDNTAPSAGVGAPAAGALVSGTVTFAATAGDANPIASVEFYVGGSSIATRSNPPFTTSWDTTGGSDGSRSLYVVVTDIAGNSTTSSTRSVTVDNDAPRPTLSDPGAGISGNATLTASSDSDTVRVDIQRSPAGTNHWTTIGSPTSSPFSVTFDTAFLVDGTYDLRAVATDQSGHVGISSVVTTRIDNTAPSASLTRPSAGATVGGPAVPLEAAASDPTSGVASVRFQYRPTGGGGFADIVDDTTAPYVGTWDATTLATGSYDLRVVATDVAGNVKESTPVTVSVDSTAPIVVLNDPGATLSGTVTLTATTSGSPATRVTFERSPAGASTWTAIATDTSTPWSASFDTTSVDDGMYDLRAVAADAYGNERTSIRSGIRIDNGVPSVISSTPADGSTIVSASSISLVASEALGGIDGATLDGAGVVAPILSGAQATFPVGMLGPGPHTLAGTLRDRAGKTRAFEIHFTIWVAPSGGGGGGGGGQPPFVERNAPRGDSTTVTAPGGGATAVMPPGAWAPHGADWLVLRIQMVPAPTGVGGPVTFESGVAEVTARWALTGIEQHTFLQPLTIDIPSGTNVAGATFDGSAWRVMREVPSPGALPGGWSDGYWVDGSGMHMLTLHLSEFAVVRALTPPTGGDSQSGSGSGSGSAEDTGTGTTTTTTRPTSTTTTTTPRPSTRLSFQVVNTKVFEPGRQVRIGARIKATRAATGTVALRNPGGGQVATWALAAKAGTNVLTLKMPRTLRAPGRYTLAWTLAAGGESAVRVTRLTIPGEASDPGSEWTVADAKPQRPDVVVAADGFGVDALALPRSVRALVASKSRDAFDLSGDERTNVRVAVLDVDRLGVPFLHDLHTVFPTLGIVAIANDPELRRRSLAAGASAAFPHAAGPARIGVAVRRLAGD